MNLNNLFNEDIASYDEVIKTLTFRSKINQAKDIHDQLYQLINDTTMMFKGDLPRINDHPFSDIVPKEIIDGRMKSLKTFEESYFNFIPPNFCWESLDLQSRMRFYYRKRIQKLCQNNVCMIQKNQISRY